MRNIFILGVWMLSGYACTPIRSVLHSSENAHLKPAKTDTVLVRQDPAQAQTSAGTEADARGFEVGPILQDKEKTSLPSEEVIASTQRTDALKIVARKPISLSKTAVKFAVKEFQKAKKKYPAGDTTILGLSPILFFALLAVAAGIILLFITGKSQFFAILTLVLLIGGLLVALASFLELI